MKNKLTSIIATGFILSTVVVLSAQEAHQPTLQSPEQTVNARKYIMKTFVANIGDIKKNIQAGNLQDISVNGGSIAAMADAIPYLFKEKYDSAYPVKGSNWYFKGAPAAEFAKKAKSLNSAALSLKEVSETGNKKDIKAELNHMKSTCGNCHAAYRGNN